MVNSKTLDQGSVVADPGASKRACNTYVVAGFSPTVANTEVAEAESGAVLISLVTREDFVPKSKIDFDGFGFHLNSILGFSCILRDDDVVGDEGDGVVACAMDECACTVGISFAAVVAGGSTAVATVVSAAGNDTVPSISTSQELILLSVNVTDEDSVGFVVNWS